MKFIKTDNSKYINLANVTFIEQISTVMRGDPSRFCVHFIDHSKEHVWLDKSELEIDLGVESSKFDYSQE